AAVHDLREASDRGDLGDRDPRAAQRLRRASSGDDLVRELHESGRKLDEPLLVRHAEQRPPPRRWRRAAHDAAFLPGLFLGLGLTCRAHRPWSLYALSFFLSVPRLMPRISAASL